MNSVNMNQRVAIIGVACRLPGGITSLSEYWDILKGEVDTITEIPDERWDKQVYGHPSQKSKGRSYVWSAGVLDNISQFDADFFGISPREAEQIDPQQRLLLELTWEALEFGGIKPEDIAGTECGVFIGVGSNDYALRRIDELESMNAYSMTGNTASICSNRISYIFDLKGPSFSVDTACSSSLVALHQACNSIRSGESSLAIAGGVNMLLHPMGFVGFSQASMLSPTGRCHAFDASGDGYVRSEGAAVVILKRLEDALKDGDQIYAIINATGINSDGRTNGISMPSSEAQSRLLDSIYSTLKVDYDNISYIEAHGTGTAVGDPLESSAISEALASKRRQGNQLLIGSAKTNLGHLEVASGMAGLLKAILCIQNRAIPASLHFETPNPNIPFNEWNLKVADRYISLDKQTSPILVGVNSFGFGGTNAHVLLEEYIPTDEKQNIHHEDLCPALYIYAKNKTSLQVLAGRYADLIIKNEDSYYDIAYSSFKYRQRLSEALVVRGATPQEIIDKLKHFAISGDAVLGVTQASSSSKASKLALVYSGNGSQWHGMGCTLYNESLVFKSAVDEVDKLWKTHANFSIVDELFSEECNSRLGLTEVAQPLLFAVQVGLTEILLDKGLIINATLGHSVGEVAAAWASGILSLPQAVKVIYERSYAQATTKGQGKMAAVVLSAKDMQSWLLKLGIQNDVVIAGINSPNSVTISGLFEPLLKLKNELNANGIVFKMLDLDYAFHGPSMDEIKGDILRGLNDLEPQKANKISFVSTVSGVELDGTLLNAEYWWQNIRLPVVFNDAVNNLIQNGVTLFVEVGPHMVLSSYMEQSLKASGQNGIVISTLKRKKESLDIISNSFYRANLAGASVVERSIFKYPGTFTLLPSYAWQREDYWVKSPENNLPLINRSIEFPLLGVRKTLDGLEWEVQLDLILMPWLSDHEVGGIAVLPAAAYVEIMLSVAKLYFKSDVVELENLEISTPITLSKDYLKTISTKITPSDGSVSIRVIHETPSDNVVCRLLEISSGVKLPKIEFPNFDSADRKYSSCDHYNLGRKVGLSYGPAFQSVKDVWVWQHQKIAWAELDLPVDLLASSSSYMLHPSLLDGCFQLLLDIFSTKIESGDVRALIPCRIGKLKFINRNSIVRWCRVIVTRDNDQSGVCDFTLFDETKKIVATLHDVRFRAVSFIHNAHAASYIYTSKLSPYFERESSNMMKPGELLNLLNSSTTLNSRNRHFKEVLPLIEVLISAYYYDALKSIIVDKKTFFINELISNHLVINSQDYLLEHMVHILADDGLINASIDGGWTLNESTLPDAVTIWRTIASDYTQYLPELTMLAQVGNNLAAVLKGSIEPTDVFSANKSSTFAHFFGDSQTFEVINQTFIIAVHKILETRPKNSRLRILELSSGTNELTKKMLTSLPMDVCEYVSIDDNEEVINNSKAIFEEIDSFAAFKLNIHNLSNELPLELSLNSFDVVICLNVLHASGEHSKTICNIQQLLRTNGLLLIGEQDSQRFNNLVYGIDPNWWLIDPVSSNASSRLFPASAWQKILEKNDFGEAVIWSEQEDTYIQNPYVLIAQSNHKIKLSDSSLTTLINKTYLLFVDSNLQSLAISEKLSEKLLALGHKVIVLQSSADNHVISDTHYLVNFDLDGCSNILTKLPTVDNLIYIAGFNMAVEISNKLTVERSWLLIKLLQALNDMQMKLKLTIVTSYGAVFDDGAQILVTKPSDSALWGLGRVAMNEYPDLDLHLLDLRDYDSLVLASDSIVDELSHESNETEVVKSPVSRRVLRMKQCMLTLPNLNLSSKAMVLDFKVAGSLNNLYWRFLNNDDVELSSDEIQIRPLATGLNFRDVMYAMGMLSDEAVENGFAGASLGMELSGVVEKVGSGIRDFRVGDEVISFAPACFSTRVITKTTTTALKPSSWSNAEAATVPTAFFTVYYALHYLARLQKGEKILIHGAAGGVGLAALQYAKYVGAEVYATAGSDEKRNYVRSMGADYVLDSRSLAFADEIMNLTNGIGVDVVLNSLYGEAVLRNLSILRPFGRFLELGKRDFYANNKIGLRPFRNNISYFGIDADQLLIEREDLASNLFKEMMGLFDSGHLKPLPHRVFGASQVEEAFRYMQQSKQIGKVVVSFTNKDREFLEKVAINSAFKKDDLVLDPGSSYLVTGGTSGFGLESAKWLVSRGAKNLILISRSGVKDNESVIAIEQLKLNGVNIYIHKVDVSDFDQMESLIKEIKDNYPKLKGILHAAAVIDDALIQHLDKDKLERVLLPKINGAYNLHLLTENIPLDFFVMFSSMTTYLGNPGQANYVAANSYLESLVHYRRSLGLPASYAAFGAIADAGFLTRNQAVKDSLESRVGTKSMLANDALMLLEKIIKTGNAGAAICDFDWSVIQRFMPAAKSPKYEQQILRTNRIGGDHNDHEDIHAMLDGLSHDEALELIIRLLAQSIGNILHVPADKIDRHKSVFELGMDSLMGVELAMSVEASFSVKLPLMALAEGATLAKLAAKILSMLQNNVVDNEVGKDDMMRSLAVKHGVEDGQISIN